MKIVKKRYYEQAFHYVENLVFTDKTKGKFLERNKFYIIDEGYYVHNDEDDEYGVYNRVCAVLFPYAVDYYKKTGEWDEHSFQTLLTDDFHYTTLSGTINFLLSCGYRFKIDIDDINLLRSVTWKWDGKVSDETLDWLIDNDCTFEGDCNYTPNFDIKL